MATSKKPTTPVDPLLDATTLQQTLGEANDQFVALNKVANVTGKEIDNINSLSTHLNNLMKDSLITQAKIGKEYVKISSIQRDINKYRGQTEIIEARIHTTVAKLSAKHATIAKDSDKALKSYIKVEETNKKIAGLTKEIEEKVAAGVKATAEKRKLRTQINNLAKAELQLITDISDENVRQVAYMKYQKFTAEQNLKLLEKGKKTQADFNLMLDISNGKLGGLASFMKGLGKIPIVGQFIQTQKILDRMEDKLESTGSKWKAFGAGAKGFGVELFRIFTSPVILGTILLGIIKKIVEGIFEFDKNITNTANNLAISKDSTQVIYKNFENITRTSKTYSENLDNAFLSIGNQGKALNDLNAGFQSSVMFTNENIQNQILLTKQMAMQADEATAIQKLSLLNSQSAESTLKTIVKQNDSVISYRKNIPQASLRQRL